MHINKGTVPPGGPHLEVAPGVKLTAATYDALYALIVEYRARHALPAGDPVKDVDDYVCGRWPHFCHADRMERAPDAAPKKLATRVAEWAGKLIREMPAGGYDLVDTREAARRAEICRTCPFQEDWRGRCSPCVASAESLLSTARKMKKTGLGDSALQGCKICGQDLRTLIWLPESVARATDEERKVLPQNCFKPKL